jgi:hypothetical protein
VVRLQQIADVAQDFVRVRLLKISGADLNVFDFDYDLTWVAFFLSADEQIYGRYGGRDARSPDSRLSLAGLRYAMQAALRTHRRGPATQHVVHSDPPVRVEDYPAAQRLRKGDCIHCHQVYEFRRDALQQTGRWHREDRWVYPLPENVGLTLEVDQGDRLHAVTPGSSADRAGLRAGDRLQIVNGLPVASIADVQYALHRAPAQGRIPVSWQHAGKEHSASIELPDGWRKTNLTWRPSMLDLLPALSLEGEGLSAREKQAMGLSAKRLAFRQQKPVHRQVRQAGVCAGDVILGLNGQTLDMTMLQFLAYVRQNFLVGDQVTLNLLRDGQRLDLPLTLH